MRYKPYVGRRECETEYNLVQFGEIDTSERNRFEVPTKSI